MMGKILCGVMGGIFAGALTLEILKRRKKPLCRGFRRLRNKVDSTLDRIAAAI